MCLLYEVRSGNCSKRPEALYSELASGAEVWSQPPRFDSSLERIMGLILKKKIVPPVKSGFKGFLSWEKVSSS
jgi:hypothetical protein